MKFSINNIEELLLPIDPKCNEFLCDLINGHNASVVTFSQGISISALSSLLIQKGVITADELTNSIDMIINNNTEKVNQLISNRDALSELIEAESEYLHNLDNMRENLQNRSQTNVDETTVDNQTLFDVEGSGTI